MWLGTLQRGHCKAVHSVKGRWGFGLEAQCSTAGKPMVQLWRRTLLGFIEPWWPAADAPIPSCCLVDLQATRPRSTSGGCKCRSGCCVWWRRARSAARWCVGRVGLCGRPALGLAGLSYMSHAGLALPAL